jgi:predicted metal-binding membrane protein
MALLFVGGVMNVLWIATISAFVLIEKIVPFGRLISRIAGAGFVAAGTWLVVIVVMNRTRARSAQPGCALRRS